MLQKLNLIFVLSYTLSFLQGLAASEHIEEKSSSYCSYNILPLDPGGSQHAIMLLPEVIYNLARFSLLINIFRFIFGKSVLRVSNWVEGGSL